MKKLVVLGLCLCLLPCYATTALAEDAGSTNSAIISTTVPATQKLVVVDVNNSGVRARIGGNEGTEFALERQSQPNLVFVLPQGYELARVRLNGVDITDKIVNGEYTLPAVYEDMVLEVETKEVPVVPGSQSQTAKPTSHEQSRKARAHAQNRGNLPRTGVYIAETGLIGFAAIGLAIFLSRKKSGKKS